MPVTLSEQDILYLVYCGIAVGVLVLFSGLAQLLSSRETRTEAKSRRLRLIAEGKTTAELLALLKPPEREGFFARLPLVGDLSGMLRKAGYTIRPRTFLLLCGGAVAVLFMAGSQTMPREAALALAVVIGVLVPLLFVHERCRRRTEALVKQLPDALDLMARGLRVGHPLNTSIGAVAQEMPDPIGTEFGLVYDQVNYGDELADAFREFAERVNVEDVNYLSASIGIQHGTGGDLVRVLDVLARTIRSRIAMRKRILAISSEGRLSAWFLSALPVIIYLFTSLLTPSYYGGVMEDPMFRPMAIIVVGLVVANAVVLRRLVNFHI